MPTKRHYKAIAGAIYEAGTKNQRKYPVCLDRLTIRLCQIFKQDNPWFNPDKFRVACRYGEHIEQKGG